MNAEEISPCLVCGDHEVPRRVAVVGDPSVVTTVAALCENAEWCQARAASRLLSGLSLVVLDGGQA